MEVHPILGRGDTPNPGLWYVISSYGQYPSMRVGHTITYVCGRDGKPDKLVIIGGANPSGVFAETHILYLDKYEWDEYDCVGLAGRYEHCAFHPDSQPDKVYIFGGADQNGNLNDMQVLDLTTEKWSNVTTSGTPPSPRTCRNSAFISDKLYVFGGGGDKSEPVTDRGMHVFDLGSLTWSQPEMSGKVPKPRQGHVMVAIGNKIYLHGGLAREIFYNDLYEFNTDTMSWKLLKCKGDVPPGCTAHAGVAISNTQFCIQGGMTPGGALDSTYVFDIENCKWQKMKLDGPPPACRLDHAMCLAYITTYPKKETNNTDNVCTENAGDAPVSDNGKDSSESTKDRTNNEQAESVEADSKDTSGDASEKVQSPQSSSDEVGVTSAAEQVNVNSSSASNNEEINQELSSKPAAEKSGEESVDSTAEAVASGLTIEGSKQDPPSSDVGANAQALTSLLSIEGVKRVMSRSGGESGTVGVEGVQKCLACVIHGGMDTGGEIFDDCLVWRVPGLPV